MGDQLQQAAAEPEVFLYEGGEVAEELRESLTRVRVGPQVTEIPEGAFWGCDKLIELQLNEGLKVIGERAFQRCRSLRSVTLPSSVTELGSFAFADCSGLFKLQLNEGLKVIGFEAFSECTALRSVTIPSSVTKWGSRAFYGCIGLDELKLKDGLQVIGECAFLRTSLRSVTLPPSVTELGNDAFLDCDKLVELQLEEGLKVIGNGAFEDCTSLRDITIPSSVIKWGWRAFAGCIGLIELQLKEGLRIIGEGAFQGCKSLRNVTVPSTVTKLGMWSFAGCSSLIELQLKEGLEVIGEGAFEGCKSLQRVSLPSSVELSEDAFAECRGLIELHLNEGLQIIGNHAFQLCTALRSVTVPSTVTELGGLSFSNCSSLTEAIFLGGKRLLNQDFFDCGFQREEQGLLDQEALNEMLFDDSYEESEFVFPGCPLTTVKISISWAVSERIARLPRKCRLSVEERINTSNLLEVQQDGNVLACFPVVRMTPGDESEDDFVDEFDVTYEVRDTNHETARSLHQVLQLIAFHELKESSIAIELAMWKSRIDLATSVPRADCRAAIPDPAKSLIMEYCGFAGFLELPRVLNQLPT